MLIIVNTLLANKTLSLEMKPTDSVHRLKQKLQIKANIRTSEQKLLYQRKTLDDDRLLSDYGITEGSILHLAFTLGGPPKKERFWSSFISKHNIPMTNRVSCYRPNFEIEFQETLDLDFLSSERNLVDCQNLWRNYWTGPDYHFTDTKVEEWVAVLELSSEFANTPEDVLKAQLDAVRYFEKGINGSYYGGQEDSWQRYTTSLPVNISIEVDEDNDNILHVVPLDTLKPSTRYAVVLLHSNHKNKKRVFYEDYLLPFITSDEIVVSRSDITLHDPLGYGAFSTVYKATWNETEMALKAIRWNNNDGESQLIENELKILKTLRHPRVLILMGVCCDMDPSEGKIGLITEFMERGSLYHVLHDQSPDALAHHPTTITSKLRICLDIVDGMRFLHHSGLLHRDLKSANVLIDCNGRCKIADFGLSTIRDRNATQTAGIMATPSWMAPEVMTGATFAPSSDVYSFGVIMWEIFSGEIPWNGLPVVTVIGTVGFQGKRLPIPEACPPLVRQFLTACFGPADARPTFDDMFDPLAQLLLENVCEDQLRHHNCSDAFICPISFEIMRDPVICADGHSYERENIEQWLRINPSSPKTNLPLPNTILIPNHNLRAAIQAWQT